jgi:four helix bundle protein
MNELNGLTRTFAIETIQFVETLNKSLTHTVIAKQLLRSGTSVGANYRAALRSKSVADFISKMGIVEEEADECLYWMDLLTQAGQVSEERLKILKDRADHIVAMTVNSIKTARSRLSS